jgi:hypothetical protein
LRDVARNAGTDSDHDAGRLVTSDHTRLQRAIRVVRCPVRVEIAAAHAGSLYLDNDLSVIWRGILDLNKSRASIS